MAGIKGMRWSFKGPKELRVRQQLEFSPFERKISELRCMYNINDMTDEQKEMLALSLLLKAKDEEEHNEACDIIKRLSLVKNYQ